MAAQENHIAVVELLLKNGAQQSLTTEVIELISSVYKVSISSSNKDSDRIHIHKKLENIHKEKIGITIKKIFI